MNVRLPLARKGIKGVSREQLDKYHNKNANIPPGTKLRADSSGQSTPAPSLQVVVPSGAIGPP